MNGVQVIVNAVILALVIKIIMDPVPASSIKRNKINVDM